MSFFYNGDGDDPPRVTFPDSDDDDSRRGDRQLQQESSVIATSIVGGDDRKPAATPVSSAITTAKSPPPPPFDEKALYRRSSDLIDQHTSGGQQGAPNNINIPRPPVVPPPVVTPGAVSVPTPAPANEKDLYRRSSDLIDQAISSSHSRPIPRPAPSVPVVVTPGAVSVPTPAPPNEKDLYRRSADLIDQQVSSSHSRPATRAASTRTVDNNNTNNNNNNNNNVVEAGRGTSLRSERTNGTAALDPVNEKSLYQRSSSLIDQLTGNQGTSTIIINGNVAVAPGAVAVTLDKIDKDLEEGKISFPIETTAKFDPVMDRARASSRAAMTKAMSSSDMSRASSISEYSKGGASTYSETLSSDGRRVPQRPSTPGAQYVRSRAMGVRPSHFLSLTRRRMAEQQQEMANVVVPTTSVVAAPPCQPLAPLEEAPVFTGFKNHYRKWYILTAILCVLATAIVVGVMFGIKHDKTNSSADTDKIMVTQFSPITKDCSSLGSQVQPHVVSQCYCHGNITTLAGDIVARYGNLTEMFIRSSAYPTTNTSFHNETIESCSPANQALVWLASGDGNVDPSSTSPSKLRQRYNLAMLFILWNGLDWNMTAGWLSSEDECTTWYGVSCDNTETMTTLSLPRNLLMGGLAEAVPWLTGIVTLILDGNNFQGSVIPTEIGQLSNLQYLQLNATGINGTIPTQLLSPSLRYINVADNSLSGTISTQVGELGQLEYWITGNNNLDGTIPSEIGRCTSLVGMELENNHLVGSIPSQIGLLSMIETLNIDQNNITGTIPTEIGLCKALITLDIGHNFMNGTIPTEVGMFAAIVSFVVQDNTFSGTLPSEIGRCTNLVYFEVSDNQLDGTIPNEFGSLGMIQLFDLQGNNFTGGVPQAICQERNDVSKPMFHCYACGCPPPGIF